MDLRLLSPRRYVLWESLALRLIHFLERFWTFFTMKLLKESWPWLTMGSLNLHMAVHPVASFRWLSFGTTVGLGPSARQPYGQVAKPVLSIPGIPCFGF